MDSELEDKINMFMQAEMPQIKMHGGDWEISDFSDGKVSIHLDGACDGCGVSPMTVDAMKKRMPSRINIVTSVSVEIGDDESVTEGPFA